MPILYKEGAPRPRLVVRRYNRYYCGVLIPTMRLIPALFLAIPAVLAAQQPVPAPAQQVEAWQIILPPQASIIYARDGSMIGEVGKELRFSVPLRSLPKYVYQAFVAVEDQRFY